MIKKYLIFAFVTLPTLIGCQTTRQTSQTSQANQTQQTDQIHQAHQLRNQPRQVAEPIKAVPSRRVPSVAAEEAVRSGSPGPLDDCLNFDILYARDEGLTAECTLNYTHYFSEKLENLIEKENIRIGTFNVYHMGDNQASLKNYKVIAQIMNQWDIVGVQELMPLSRPQAKSNDLIFQLLSQTDRNNDFVRKKMQVERPGYLNLLTELRSLDPSWALILQPEAEGEGGIGEMTGFYYRQSVVQLREWDYCPSEKATDLKLQRSARNYACLVHVPDQQQKLISRRAFAAYFQSGHFDFIGLTAHVRFRPTSDPEALKAQIQEVCRNHATPKKCKPTNTLVGRYYEVKVIIDQIKSMQAQAKDQDVIYMGDFNLEYSKNTIPYWNAVLKSAEGLQVFQHSPTTLGVKKNALASSYDHFIFNPQITKVCPPEKVSTYDFTSYSATGDSLQKLIAAAVEPDRVKAQIQNRMQQIRSLAKAKVSRGQIIVSHLEAKEISDYEQRFKDAAARMQESYMAATLDLLSDHIPVEMECSTKKITGDNND